MYIKISIVFILGFVFLSTTSCDKETDSEIKQVNMTPNKFPINYVGEKILKFNKPYTLPQGGLPIIQDTVKLYSVTNKSSDTIWVETVPKIDTTDGYFKDKSIKTILRNNVGYHRINDKQWGFASDGNGCWGGCNDSLKLLPHERLFFIYGLKRWVEDNDSATFAITVKIKKGNLIKDSIVTKKLVLKNNYFIEDTKYWKSIEK